LDAQRSVYKHTEGRLGCAGVVLYLNQIPVEAPDCGPFFKLDAKFARSQGVDNIVGVEDPAEEPNVRYARLQQTYDITDLKGGSFSLCTFSSLNLTTESATN